MLEVIKDGKSVEDVNLEKKIVISLRISLQNKKILELIASQLGVTKSVLFRKALRRVLDDEVGNISERAVKILT